MSGGANVGSGDFNGDGKPDLVDGYALYLGNGDGTFGSPSVLDDFGSSMVVKIGYVEGIFRYPVKSMRGDDSRPPI